jgi:hypothetical protein
MSIFPVPLFAPWFGAQPANCPIYVGLEACAKKTAVKFSLPFCRRGLEACAKKTATPRVASPRSVGNLLFCGSSARSLLAYTEFEARVLIKLGIQREGGNKTPLAYKEGR